MGSAKNKRPNGKRFRERPKGKACMNRKFKVDSIGFWNIGFSDSEKELLETMKEIDGLNKSFRRVKDE